MSEQSSEEPLQPAELGLESGLEKLTVTFTLTGEAALRFRQFSKGAGIANSLSARVFVLDGMKARGLLPAWYTLEKMRKKF